MTQKTSPVRAQHFSLDVDMCRALSGLYNWGFDHSQGVALVWYVAPLRGFLFDCAIHRTKRRKNVFILTALAGKRLFPFQHMQ
jgi:hypothetical protein